MIPASWKSWKKWFAPVAGTLLVLPAVGMDWAGIALIAPVTVGVLFGALVLLDYFKVV